MKRYLRNSPGPLPPRFRSAFNALSDVIVNRPPALREFDQIYMKAGDMLVQAAHVSDFLSDLDVIFIGDGDALSLSLLHLHRSGCLEKGPRSVRVLDFDQRVVNSVARFAETFGYTDSLSATLYNVVDPIPGDAFRRYGAFYTNPPFGASNHGASVTAFLSRGLEAVGESATACIVLADGPDLPWTPAVITAAQERMVSHGFHPTALTPAMHTYHLDDTPALTSCGIVMRRHSYSEIARAVRESQVLPSEVVENFYGAGANLRIQFVRDLRNGAKFASRDHELVPISKKQEPR